MRLKDTIRLAKKALKQPWLYSEEELTYMRKAKKAAKQQLKQKHMRIENAKCETDSSDSESRGDDGIYRQSEQSPEPGQS